LAGPIILALAGADFGSSVQLLKVLVVTVPIMTASEFLMYQLLIPSGQNELQNKSRLYTLLISVALVYPAVHFGGSVGAAWLNLGAETFIVLIIILGIQCKPPQFNSKQG